MRLSSDFQLLKRRASLHDLASRIREVEEREMGVFVEESGEKVLSTGWAPVDEALAGGGLRRGATDEWLTSSIQDTGGRGTHAPALAILTHLARRALFSERAPGGASAPQPFSPPGEKVDASEASRRMRGLSSGATGGLSASASGVVTWIGRATWPYPQSLIDDGDELLRHSLFIEARTIEERVWAADLSLRCPGVRAVIADASGLDMSASRRLQLAAASASAIGLLSRSERERGAISASMTRWAVGPVRTDGRSPRWELRLLRCKAGASARAESAWLVEARHGQGIVCVSADVEHRPAAPAQQSKRAERLRIA